MRIERVSWVGRLAAVVAAAGLAGCVGALDGPGSGAGDEAAPKGPAEDAATCEAAEALLFGVNIDPANPAAAPSPEEVRALGARWVRIEWKRELGFDFYDPLIAGYRDAGIRVLLLVDYTSTPVGKPSSAAPDEEWSGYLAEFAATAAELAEHYRDGVDAWEIWNEPDQPPEPGYDPGVPARVFGPLLRDASAAIRPRSSRPLVVGGLSSGQSSYYLECLAAVGGWLDYDAVGVHPYGKQPDGYDQASGTGSLGAFYDEFLAVSGLPLWVTEFGTWDDADQPQYTRAFYETTGSRYLDRVPVAFVFAWSDTQRPGFPFGLHDVAGGRKPSFDAYASAAPAAGLACPSLTGSSPPPEDPPAEDPPAEDPPAEDPPAEDPPTEDPPAEDPPAEEPPAEEPPPEEPPPEEPAPGGCPCRTDVDNVCLYGPSAPGCDMTWPGGYCDPNGDGSFDDADWERGWYDHLAICGG